MSDALIDWSELARRKMAQEAGDDGDVSHF